MELNLFRSFVAVAEARSFSRAARTMHSTPAQAIAPATAAIGPTDAESPAAAMRVTTILFDCTG